VADGKMSQEQADEYLEWYEARPDVPAGLGFKGMRGSHRPAGLGGFGAPPAPAE